MITSRSYMNVKPVQLYLSLKSLRRGIVKITTEDEDPHGIWVEDSGIVSIPNLYIGLLLSFYLTYAIDTT